MPEEGIGLVTERRRRWWRRGVPAAAAILAAMALELIMRFAPTPGIRPPSAFYVSDPDRGYALRPRQRGWVNLENRVWMSINSDGMRDREHAIAHPPQTIRIAVLGDSYMQGLNLPFERSFVSLLESAVTACLPTGWEAESLNFGVSGYGTAQELLTYRHHASKYRPDIVLLAIYTGNDIFNNHRSLSESSVDGTPYFVLDGDELVLDALDERASYPWYQHWRIALTDRSLLASVMYAGWGALREHLGESRAEAMSHAGPDEPDAGAIYRPPATEPIAEAWRVTEALLLALSREVAAQGAELWLVTLSNAEQVHPDPAVRADDAARLGVATLFYPDHRIRDFATGHGIPVVTLAESLAEYAATHRAFLNGGYNALFPPGSGHWNETANQLAASIVSGRVCRDSSKIALLY